MKRSKKKHPGNVKKSVSFPDALLASAMARAGELNRSFSNYMQTLVDADLRNSGVPVPKK